MTTSSWKNYFKINIISSCDVVAPTVIVCVGFRLIDHLNTSNNIIRPRINKN